MFRGIYPQVRRLARLCLNAVEAHHRVAATVDRADPVAHRAGKAEDKVAVLAAGRARVPVAARRPGRRGGGGLAHGPVGIR